MTRVDDREALRAWAEALRSGLGLVRFSELSASEFDDLLDSAGRRDVSFYVAIARHASLEGLDVMRHRAPDVPEIQAALARRREELRPDGADSPGGELVAFPRRAEPLDLDARATRATATPSPVPSPAPDRAVAGGWFVRARTRVLALLAAFAEEPSAYDEPAPEHRDATETAEGTVRR